MRATQSFPVGGRSTPAQMPPEPTFFLQVRTFIMSFFPPEVWRSFRNVPTRGQFIYINTAYFPNQLASF